MPMSGLEVVRSVVLELRRILMDVMDSSSTIRSEVTERCLPPRPGSRDELSHQPAWPPA